MEIKDLQARMGNVEVTLEIVEKGEAREFEKFGKTGRVCNAEAQDSSGKIKITLWNEDIDKVNVGDKVQIKNGWVGEYQGELQLSTGKFGSLEVLGKSDSTDQAPQEEEAPSQESPAEKTQEEPVEQLTEEPVTQEESVE